MTNKGLRIELPLLIDKERYGFDSVAMLDCHYENDFSGAIGIPLRETATSSVFTRFTMFKEPIYSVEQMEEAEIRTIYIVKQLPKPKKVMSDTCLIRWEPLQLFGYEILLVKPENFRWNPETMVLNMKFKSRDSKTIDASACIVFSRVRSHDCFAIILSLKLEALPFAQFQTGRKVSGRSVKIVPKPGGTIGLEWLEGYNEPEIDWSKDNQTYQVVQFPSERGEESQLMVSAGVTEEEILNQKITVLDVRIEGGGQSEGPRS